MGRRAADLFGVMHIGSEQVSLQIVEYSSLNDMRPVERVTTQVSLGEETFKTGRIGFAAVRELCGLLKGYRRILGEYGVKDYRLLATTALREAENQEYIIDQIKIKTGFAAEVVDMPQEIFYKYVALFRAVEAQGVIGQEQAILFVDISSGGLGITLFEDGNIQYQQNIHIGALRVKESFEKSQREAAGFYQALTEYINSTIEPVDKELSSRQIKYLVLSGAETGLLMRMLGAEEEGGLTLVSTGEFLQLFARVKNLNPPQLMQEFGLPEERAEMVLPTLVLYHQMLAVSDVARIIVSNAQFADGIIISHIAGRTNDRWLDVIERQVVSFANSLGQKYRHDPEHAGRVAECALILFDRLTRVHGLGRRERFLLQVAAILHDIGKFVSLRRHYFYSYRLIVSSDIIGFSEAEKALIANIAYYHSKGTPSNADPNFAALTPEQKMDLAKLAAIIRLADAIDRSHLQKAVIREVALSGEELTITIASDRDTSLEEWTFLDKTEFFENVFGIKPILKRQAG